MADPKDMTLADAADVVRAVARDRLKEARAFEKIEQTLGTAVSVQSAMARLTKQRDALVAEIETLQHQHATVVHTCSTEMVKLDVDLQATAEIATKRKAELTAEIDTVAGELADLHRKLSLEASNGAAAATLRTTELQAKCDRIEAAHRAVLREVLRKTEEAQANLKTTQDRFAQVIKDATQTAGVS
jgi:hypothetical protein